MELVAYLVVGVLLLAFLRRFVFRRVLEGQMLVWVGAVLAGAVWAGLPVMAVLIAGAELIPIVWVFSAGGFLAGAMSLLVFLKMMHGRGDQDRAN